MLLPFPLPVQAFFSIIISVFVSPTPQNHPHVLSISPPTVAVFSRQPHPEPLIRDTREHTGPSTSSLRPVKLFKRVGKRRRPFPHFCGSKGMINLSPAPSVALPCSISPPSISRHLVCPFNLEYVLYFPSVTAV